jgi:predicted TIM-barrel fold metal-dependent hydrolase
MPLAVNRPRAGFAGVSIGADRFDDPGALGSILDALRGHGFLFVHPVSGSRPGWAPDWWPAVAEYTSQMQRAYLTWLGCLQEQWSDVNVVFAVLAGGGLVQLERLASRGVPMSSALHDNVYFDTASYGRRAIAFCIETVGVEQLVYGSDVPVIDPRATVQALESLGESAETLIRQENARRLMT